MWQRNFQDLKANAEIKEESRIPLPQTRELPTDSLIFYPIFSQENVVSNDTHSHFSSSKNPRWKLSLFPFLLIAKPSEIIQPLLKPQVLYNWPRLPDLLVSASKCTCYSQSRKPPKDRFFVIGWPTSGFSGFKILPRGQQWDPVASCDP